MLKSKGIRFLFLCLCSVLCLPTIANATLVTVDEIIYETNSTNPTDPSFLAGTVDMTFSGTTLTIILTNTSTDVASTEASFNLLTGLGFFLPGTLQITGGSVNMDDSTPINFEAPSDKDVSGEWGYDNAPFASGPFQTVPAGETLSTVNAVVSVMESSTTKKFSNIPIKNPDGLAGPEFGLLSGDPNVGSGVAGGQNAIQDSVILTLTLGGDWNNGNWNEEDLINFINQGDVVLSFGSPNVSAVPEPATILLLSSGLIGLAGYRTRRRFKK